MQSENFTFAMIWKGKCERRC